MRAAIFLVVLVAGVTVDATAVPLNVSSFYINILRALKIRK